MVDIRKDLNVFAMSAVAGQVAMESAAGPETMTVMMDSESDETLAPAYPVMLVAGASSIPLVDLAEPGTDEIYGLVIANPKIGSWEGGDVLQVTTRGTIIYLEAGESIDRGVKVGLNEIGYTLCAAYGMNCIGTLLDDVTSGDLGRVEIEVPISGYAVCAS